MTAGHDHTRCERDFSVTSRDLKNESIPTFKEFEEEIKIASKTWQFQIHEIKAEEFLDFSVLLQSVHLRKYFYTKRKTYKTLWQRGL